MDINAGDQRPSRGSSFLSDTFDTWYRKVQYEPWFIKLSTINHKILLAAGILVILIIVIIAVASSSSGGKTAKSWFLNE